MQSEKSKQLLAEIAKSKVEITRIKAELKDKIQENFHGMAGELFNTYPELKSFGWRQYTPFFNDGEACTFSSNHDCPSVNGVDRYGDDEVEEGAIDIMTNSKEKDYDGPNPNFNPYYKEIIDTLTEFLNQFDDDDMYDLFDDHVTVKITPEGCFTEDYDHD